MRSGGVYFDGKDDYVATPSFALSSPTNTLTYAFWVNCSKRSDGEQGFLSDKKQSTGSGFIWTLRYINSDDIWYQYSNGTAYRTAICRYFFTGYDNKWVHAVIVADYDGQNIKFYRNGELFKNIDTGETMLFPSVNLAKYIGSYYGYAHWLKGYMDDVRLYTRALTEEEIMRLYEGKSISNERLELWYKFDDNFGVVRDYSGKKRHGRLYGARPLIKKNTGLLFDGKDDYVEVPHSSYLNMDTNEITIAAMVKPQKENAYQFIVSKSHETLNEVYYGLRLDANNKFCFYSNGAVGGNTEVSLGKWYRIVATFDGATANMYIDGQLENSASVSWHLQSTKPVIIGEWIKSGGIYASQYFGGFIGDIRIYNRILSSEEINDLYYGQEIDSDGLVLHLPMKEKRGIVKDVSGRKNHGRVYGVKPTVKRNEGFVFDGIDGYIQTESFGMNGTVLTFSAWVNCARMSQLQTLIGDGRQSSTEGFIFSYRDSYSEDVMNNLVWQYANGSSVSACVSDGFFSGYDNQWVHAVVVCDYVEKVTKIYRNGELVNQVEMSGTPVFPSVKRPKYIGSYSKSIYTHRLKGYIDDVRIYNRALNEKEIRQLYEGKKISDSGLVLHLDSKHVNGNVVMDLSGNGNNGTLYGAKPMIR